MLGPAVRGGLRWLGRRYDAEGVAKLTQAGEALGLHRGLLLRARGRCCRVEMPRLLRGLRHAVFTGGGILSTVLFRVVGRGRFPAADRARLLREVQAARSAKRGIVTVSNHVGTIDDPVLWGALPFKFVVLSGHRRWIWASQEICFKNWPTAFFFGLGQCLPVVRGAGLEQPSVAELQARLDEGEWCHVFSEGMCNQTGEVASFRWGVGRLVAHAQQCPTVLAMAHTGMEVMYPQAKTKVFPRLSRLHMTCGSPIDVAPLWHKARAVLSAPEPDRRKLEAVYAEITALVEAAVRCEHARCLQARSA